MIESLSIVFIAFGGFLLALYIFHKKHTKTDHFVCPLRGNCSEVIQSDYSKFFGVPVEILGMLYYASLTVGHGLLITFPEALAWLDVYLLIASTAAFLFSLYLTFIQLVALRKICTWCLVSATMCVFIFILTIFETLEIVLPLLIDYRSLIITLHVLSMALGLGAATLTDVFFFRFLKDSRISQDEANVLSTLTEFIWFALCLVVMTGLALYLPQAGNYLEVPKFFAKMVVVGVILVNGAFLNLYIAPKLVKISFGERHHHKEGELGRARRLAFALGPISIISWYSAFILGSLPADSPLAFWEFIKIYALLLVIGVTIGQFVDNRMSKRAVPWTEF
ncbi:vitamin K epoxide reductase family protein [Candidatus Uhrbacteria bacterium]|nr:vitamin K epoxide reductase family protein [Candidatus Uhrbacteria bacterium]